jgi:hypothetical protein
MGKVADLLMLGPDLTELEAILMDEEITDEDKDEALCVYRDKIGSIESMLESLARIGIQAKRRGEGIKAERDRLARLAETCDNTETRMKHLCRGLLGTMGRSKHVGKLVSVAIQNNGGVVPLKIDEKELPGAFFKIVRTPDTDEIRHWLKIGIAIPGVAEEPRGTHVRFS